MECNVIELDSSFTYEKNEEGKLKSAASGDALLAALLKPFLLELSVLGINGLDRDLPDALALL